MKASRVVAVNIDIQQCASYGSTFKMILRPFVHTPAAPEGGIEAGIIEDARARQRKHQRIAATLFALAVIALFSVIGFGGGGNGGSGGNGGVGHSSGSGGSGNPHSGGPSYASAPRSQTGKFSGAHSEYVCPLAARNRYLPSRAGCVSVKRADIDGDGRTDLVVLYANLSSQEVDKDYLPLSWTLEVARASGPIDRIQVDHGDEHPFLVRMANVNDFAGSEIFLQLGEISSGSPIAVYSYGDGAIHQAGVFFAGGDSADRERFSCRTKAPARVTQETMSLLGPTIYGRWRWTTTTYLWHGAALARQHPHSTVHTGLPTLNAAAFGGGCGTPAGPIGDQ